MCFIQYKTHILYYKGNSIKYVFYFFKNEIINGNKSYTVLLKFNKMGAFYNIFLKGYRRLFFM